MTDETLFARAIAIPDPQARGAFLDRACPEPAQRARLDRLLAAHREDRFLEPPDSDGTRAAAQNADLTRSLVPDGRTDTFDPDRTAAHGVPGATPVSVPGYELLGVLGEGGMGVVYRARQTAVDRVVALKMIRGGLGSAAERARFRAEAEAAAKLTHPGIARVYEFGEVGGTPYFTLEYCDGGSLAGKLDGTPWHPNAAARLTEMLADAVAAAHTQGIVHRDLKPANVLLARMAGPDGGTVTDPNARPLLYATLRAPHGAVPKVTDFGISKRLDSPDGPTATGAVMGTPSYMSPEQARGDSKTVGPAADVYALGAILYELLTGRPPFKAASVMETLDLVRAQEPVAVRALNPACPRDLETICLKCLQKEPAKRYSDATELADDLRRFQEGRPIAARPVGAVERGWRWCRRNPAVASLLAAVVLVLDGGITATTWGLIRALDAEADTREALTRVTEEEQKVRGERDEKEKARAAEEESRKGLQIELLSRQIDDITAQAQQHGDGSLLAHYLRLLPTLPPHANALRDYLQLKILVLGKAQYEIRSRQRQSVRGSMFSATSTETIRLHHDGTLSVGDPLTAVPRVTMRVPGVQLDYVTHSDNNRVVVAKNVAGTEGGSQSWTAYYFFDMVSGQLQSQVPTAQRTDAQIGRDGSRYLSYRNGRSAKDALIELWDTTSGKLIGAWPDNRLANHSPNSKLVVAFGKVDERPQPVRIYAASDGQVVHTIPQGADRYLYAAITPSGKYLVTYTCKEVRWWRTSDWKPEGKPSRTRNSDRQIPLRYGTTGMARLENSNTRSRYVFDEYALMVGSEQGEIGDTDKPVRDGIGGSTEVLLRGQEDPRGFPGAPVYCDESSLVLERGDYIEFAPFTNRQSDARAPLRAGHPHAHGRWAVPPAPRRRLRDVHRLCSREKDGRAGHASQDPRAGLPDRVPRAGIWGRGRPVPHSGAAGRVRPRTARALDRRDQFWRNGRQQRVPAVGRGDLERKAHGTGATVGRAPGGRSSRRCGCEYRCLGL